MFRSIYFIHFVWLLLFLLPNHNFLVLFSSSQLTSSVVSVAEAKLVESKSLICQTHPRYCEMRRNPLPACVGACFELQEYRVKDREACVLYCKRHFGWSCDEFCRRVRGDGGSTLKHTNESVWWSNYLVFVSISIHKYLYCVFRQCSPF